MAPNLSLDPALWQAFEATCLARGQQPRVLLEAFMAALMVGWAQHEGLLDATEQAQLDAVIADAEARARRHTEGGR